MAPSFLFNFPRFRRWGGGKLQTIPVTSTNTFTGWKEESLPTHALWFRRAASPLRLHDLQCGELPARKNFEGLLRTSGESGKQKGERMR